MRTHEGSRANLSPLLEKLPKTFLTNSDSWGKRPCNLVYHLAQKTHVKPSFPCTCPSEVTDLDGAGRTRLLDTIAPGQSRTRAAFSGDSDFF